MRRDRVPSAIDDDLVSECLSILDRVWPRRDASQAGDSSGSAADSNSADSDSCGADSTDRGSTECDSADAAPLESFGRFELHEARGQGGYGLVFRAYDTRLRREVALKVPRPDVLATRAMRARFLREAQAAAALDHPNIVPVLDAGEEGSLWYIVTAYCPGPTLAEWLAEHEGPVDPRIAASLVAELADGVQHAHFRGVLHRDLKPSNVLLEPVRGEIASGRLSFQPRITDFGLAKRLDDPGDETRTGVVLGTLKYMSPEQAAGRVREIGVASDVYALGVMLYEMLCGRAPHDAETNTSLARKIVEDPPLAPRQLRRNLSRDLETVCLKCLEKRHEHRYASAGELAADLRRYLAGEPVSARALGAPLRLLRWARQRPALAMLSAALLLSTLAGVLGMAVMLVRERGLRRDAELAEQSAERQSALAHRVIDEMYSDVAEEWLTREPRAEAMREKMLTKALGFYDQLCREAPNDPARLYDLNVALHRAANFKAHLGRRDEAIETRKRCLQVIERLIEIDPHNVDYRFARFQNRHALSVELQQRGDPAYAELRELAAREIRELADLHPDNVDLQEALLGVMARTLDDQLYRLELVQAEPLADEFLQRSEALVQKAPRSALVLKTAGSGWTKMARLRLYQGRRAEAVKAQQRGVAYFVALTQVDPNNPAFEETLLSALTLQASIFIASARPDEAIAAFEYADRLAASLQASFPEAPRFAMIRHRITVEEASARFQQGRWMEAFVMLSTGLQRLREFRDDEAVRQEVVDVMKTYSGVRLSPTAATEM